ncbi:MAG: HEAT repeat domain-containing protein [Anaerolineae bacterium]|nr:HEAT repeat domain-containing protein [Anaerolineae bacterium]
MPDPLLHPLLSAIAAGDDAAADAAVHQLAQRGPEAYPALVDLYASPDPDRRWWAVRGLAALAEAEESCREHAIPALAEAMADADEAVRCAAALAMGRLQAASAIPSLILLLADPSGWVRGAAADALAMMGETALPALGEAIQDPREGVRVRAAYALRKICSPKSARWLFPALNDPNPLVHTYAYETLDQLGLLNNILLM